MMKKRTAAIILLLSQWMFLQGTGSVLPLEFWDEAVYIRGVFDLPLPMPGWGPAYVYWYAGLRAIFTDPIRTFHMNAIIVTALLSWGSFLWLIRLRAHPLVALAGGLWILLWKINFTVMPKINHLNTCALLLWSLAGSLIPGRLGAKCLVLSALLLPLVYLRQENLLVAAALLFFAGARLYRERTYPSARHLTAFSLMTALSLYCFFMYSPFENRGFAAFIDHYLFSMEKLNPAITRPVIENEIFRGASSIIEAAWRNPAALTAYWGRNYWIFITTTLPKSIFLHHTTPAYAPAAFFALVLLFRWRARRWGAPAANAQAPGSSIFLAVTAALGFKSLVIVGMMEAVPRYFLDLLVFSSVILMAGLPFRPRGKAGVITAIAVAAGVLIFIPNVTSPGVRAELGPGGGAGFREAVDFLNRKLKPSDRVFAQPAYTAYATHKVESCELYCKHYADKLRYHWDIADFIFMLQREKMDWIVVDHSLLWKISERLPGGPNRAVLDGLDSASCINLVFRNMNAKIYHIDQKCLAAVNGAAAMD